MTTSLSLMVQSPAAAQLSVVDLQVLSLLEAPQEISYSPFQILFLHASCPVQLTDSPLHIKICEVENVIIMNFNN